MWYDKLRKEGIIVRGTVLEETNSFYEDIDDAIEDVYIECMGANKEDQIFCYTASTPYLRNHIYEVCIYSYGRGMNTLRKFYMKELGTEKDIKMIRNGKQEWNDDKLVSQILADGRISEITLCDGEVYFKSDDLNLIKSIVKIKKVKGTSKDPFDSDYLNWDKYAIPKADLDLYEETKKNKYGDDHFELGTQNSCSREIQKATKEFLLKNKIDLNVKIKHRIKDNKSIIHHLGLWQKYVGYIKRF